MSKAEAIEMLYDTISSLSRVDEKTDGLVIATVTIDELKAVIEKLVEEEKADAETTPG